MGVFDFWKKLRSDFFSDVKKSENVELGECTDNFKYLDFINNYDDKKEVKQNFITLHNTSITDDNEDSRDCIVFISFDTTKKERWVCSECGTSNEEGLSGCVVCGLKR